MPQLTLNGSAIYDDAATKDSLDAANITATITTLKFTHILQSIATTETALDLGNITAPGWVFFKNKDANNYVEILTATGGTKFALVRAGKFAGPFELSANITAPFAQANTAAVILEIFVVSK
mgnify:CR=1 FL=1